MAPVPGARRTRAIALLRLPTVQISAFLSAISPGSLRRKSFVRSALAPSDLELTRLLRGMRMLRPAIDLELGEQPPPEPVFGQHPSHRFLEQPFGPRFHQARRSGRPHAAGITGVAAVDLALELGPGQAHFAGVDDDHEVAG